MSDHTQHDEAAQLRLVNEELREQLAIANKCIEEVEVENMQLRKRIAELEAGQPHIVDPENYDYTSGGVAVRDLVNRGGECYVWFSPSLLDSWTISGKWAEGSHIPDRDLIPTPKASKGKQQ